MFVFDEDDGLVWGNRRLQELTGLAVEELRDLDPTALFGRADARAVRKVLAAIRAGEESATVQVALRSDEDETIVCDFTGHRLPTDTELPGTVLGVGRELSRLESRERALRRERDRLAALYSGLPSPVVHYEVEEGEALIRGVNTAFEEVFGL
ncbi:MAG: PAS domain S-box protein, partial [Salinibacter sp.]